MSGVGCFGKLSGDCSLCLVTAVGCLGSKMTILVYIRYLMLVEKLTEVFSLYLVFGVGCLKSKLRILAYIWCLGLVV